tara:strand:- start:242 stop:373 length:132 start_codon:yes stop_codon:yes gene_type:complete
MDKEIIYQKLNEILDSLNGRKLHEAKVELEGLLNEIKYGIYDK